MSFKFFFLNSLVLCASIFNQAEAQSPTSAARGFNIFVKGDATLISNETEGPVAIGGNLTSNQYQISFDKKYSVFSVNGATIGLAVRGGVKLNNGSFQITNNNYAKIGNCTPNSSAATNLKVWYKDNNNAMSPIRITGSAAGYSDTPNISLSAQANVFTPNVSASVNPVCENVFGTGDNQIDVDGAFTQLVSRSAQLAAMADNVAIRDQNGNIMQNAPVGPYTNTAVIGNNPKIILDPNKINVLTVSAAVWEAIKNSNIEGIPSGPQAGTTTYTGKFGFVVNIINYPAFVASKGNTKVNFPSVGGLSDSQGSYVIYNFPDATDKVTLGGSTPIHGTVFAPQADLVKENSGNINGQIIAKSFYQSQDEVHFWPFLPSIAVPVTPKLTLTAQSKCLEDKPYLDYTVTPNYDATGQSAKIEWLNSEGTVVRTDNNQSLTGSILFPGVVESGGAVTGYPGYIYANGKWSQVTDLNSTIRTAGAKIRVTLTPTESIDITYPASTLGCLTSPPPTTPLPVTLATFTARNENCNVQLKWVVTEATNFSHFVVQRSADAKNFASLSEITFDPNKKDYSYTDSPYSTEASPARYYYYRLKQVDLDQKTEYSTLRSVETGQCDARLAVDFYPNPTQDEVNVKSYSPVKMLEILTVGGKRIYSVTPAANQTQVKVNVQSLTQGLYIVNIVNQEGKHTSKILKK